MKTNNKDKLKHRSIFERFSHTATKASGSPWAFVTACTVIVVWLISGPVFDFSDTWQLIINTGTTIVTFLMVFLIQKSQNRDSITFQLKLNELIVSQKGASNRLLDVDDLSEEELETLLKFYIILSKRAKKDASITESHSIEEIEALHREKTKDFAKKVRGSTENPAGKKAPNE